MSSRKIIITGPAYPYRGGIAAFNERLAHELIAQGNDVEVVTFTLQYPSFLFPGKTQFSEGPAPADLKIERKINSMNPLNWIKVGRQLKKKKADLIIIAFWLPYMAPALGTIARIMISSCPKSSTRNIVLCIGIRKIKHTSGL